MKLEEILHKILDIAEFPKDKKTQFVNTFYEYFFVSVLTELEKKDKKSFEKLKKAIGNPSEEEIKNLLTEISKEPEAAKVIDEVSDEVIVKLVDDIANHATEDQKKEILASVGT